MKTETINTSIYKHVFGQSEVAKLVSRSNASSSHDSAILIGHLCQSSVQFVHHSFLFLFCVKLLMLVSVEAIGICNSLFFQ